MRELSRSSGAGAYLFTRSGSYASPIIQRQDERAEWTEPGGGGSEGLRLFQKRQEGNHQVIIPIIEV